jgi:hypothetical protein
MSNVLKVPAIKRCSPVTFVVSFEARDATVHAVILRLVCRFERKRKIPRNYLSNDCAVDSS